MGYHVAETYHPMVKYEDFPEMETALEFEKRIAAFVDEASDTTDKWVIRKTPIIKISRAL